MKASNFHNGPKSDHVSLELLRQYQADALLPAEQHRVEKHLLDCDLCADMLAGIEASPAPVTMRAVQDINQRVAASLNHQKKVIPLYTKLKQYGVAAAVLLLIFSGALVIYYNFTAIKQAEKTAVVKELSDRKKEETIVKPAAPAVAHKATETTNNPTTVPDKPVIAFHKPVVPVSAAPAVKKQQMVERPIIESVSEALVIDAGATAPADQKLSEVVAEAPIKKEAVGNAAAPVAPDDSLLKAKSIKVEQALQGRVAGVQTTNSETKNIYIRGTASSPMQNKAIVTGRAVTGKVFSEDGEALPGVTITINGTQTGTTTNAAGEYVLALPEGIDKPTLIFSYIGFVTTKKQIAVKLASPVAVNIELKPDALALSEVVVVGYGTQRKSDVTGAIAYAKPIAGMRSFKKYVQANLKYPEAAKDKKIKGRVVVGFTVSPDGSLSDFKIIKSLSPESDAEALRLVREGPRWEPTRKDNMAVTEHVRIGIRFKPPR